MAALRPVAALGSVPHQSADCFGAVRADPVSQLRVALGEVVRRLAPMFVIPRNTAFTYQSKRVDTKRIGRELGVRYVPEGSVRRLGNRVRVNAQLIDAETNAHLWAGRFDGDTLDLFALQNEITSRIANCGRIIG